MRHPIAVRAGDPAHPGDGLAPGAPDAALLTLAQPRGRRLLAAAVLASGLVFLDGTIANVALPRLGQQFGASLGQLQWVINGYTLALASLILVGGSLGDRLGRRRVFAWGVGAFSVLSVVTAQSGSIHLLVAARIAQGVAAALLTPGSLAMLQASFVERDRMRAIGAWTGMLGIATAAGPVLGGWLVGIDWRIAFWINLPLGALVLWLLRTAPESRDPQADTTLDLPGLLLAPVCLASLTWALTAWPERGLAGAVAAALGLAAASGAAFVAAEARSRHPLVPLGLFADRDFAIINLVTLAVYAALAATGFFLGLELQVGAGWSPLMAGAASVPISVVMLVLAGRFGALAARTGARVLVASGSLLVALAMAWLSLAPQHPDYLRQLLGAVCLQGLGLSMLVAPLTGTVLAAAPPRHAGLASGINNALSRTAGLLAIAALPLMVGLSGTEYRIGEQVWLGYRSAMRWCAAACLVGAAIALGLRPATGRAR